MSEVIGGAMGILVGLAIVLVAWIVIGGDRR